MNSFLEDDKWLCDMRDQMKPDEYMFPLGCRIGKSYYKISDISNPEVFKDTSITQSNFRVIFGSMFNMFRRNSFPVNKVSNYTILKNINSLDEKTMVQTTFFIFESGPILNDDISAFDNVINENYDLIFDYVTSVASINKKHAVEAFYEANKNI